MRILHIITKLSEIYGAQRHVVESIKSHLSHSHECMVIAGEVGLASSMVADLGVVVKLIDNLKNSYNVLTGYKAIKETRKIIRHFKPDLVISHSSIAGIIARIACYFEKVPNIFTVHGWPFEIGAKWHQRLAGLATEWLLNSISDSYVCVSNYTALYGIKALKFINTRRIYVCSNMHRDEPYERPNPFCIHKSVLMVAGFRAQKDHISAVKALEVIVKQGTIPGLKMTFVGDGPRRKIIEKYISKHQLENYIELAGAVKDVNKYYDECDVVILPTYYEGLPLSLIEAIQKGKPVIATNVGGNNEIIEDKVNGNLIKVEDYHSLANHLIDYYHADKIEKYSYQSRKIYESRFSYEQVSKHLNFIISNALKHSRFKKDT